MSKSKKKARYVKPINELSGYQTALTEKSYKGLAPRFFEPPAGTNDGPDAGRMPQTQPAAREKELNQRLPQSIRKDRQIDIPSFVFNVTDASPNSRGRTVMKTPQRTIGIPGQQYGHPTNYTYNTVTRRPPFQAGLKTLFPTKRQKHQHARLMRYDQRRYIETKAKYRTNLRLRYRILKNDPRYKRDKAARRKYPYQFRRRGLGYGSASEKAKDWRRKNKSKAEARGENAARRKRQNQREQQRKRRREKMFKLPKNPYMKRNEFKRKASYEYEWEIPVYLEIREGEYQPLRVLDFDVGGHNVIVADRIEEDVWAIPLGEFLANVIPESEEESDELLDILEYVFGEAWVDHHNERLGSYVTFYRTQKYPENLDQNQRPNRGTPRSDKIKNDHTWGPPSVGNSVGMRSPTSWVGPTQNRWQGQNIGPKDNKIHGQPFSNPDLDWGFPQPAVGQSGSAKVVPPMNLQTGDLAYYYQTNPTDKRGLKTAATRKEMLRWTDKLTKDRSKTYNPEFIRYEPGRKVFVFNTGDYSQWVRVLPRKGSKQQNVHRMDMRVRCSCPFWQWQGPEHWGADEDYQYGKLQGTAAFPYIRDPTHQHAVCKHMVAVLNHMKEKKMKIPALASLPRQKRGRYFSDREESCRPDASRVARRHLGIKEDG